MVEVLLISNLILWVLVVFLALLAFALSRQVGVLFERIAPAGALAMNKKLAGGDMAPALRLTALDGHDVEIGEPSDPSRPSKAQLVFFLSPDCPICKTLVPVVKSIAQRERDWLDLVFASDGENHDEHLSYIRALKIDQYPYVLSRPLGVQYGVAQLPFGVLIDRTGRISGLGLVNSREHLESLIEALLMKTPTIQEHFEIVDKENEVGEHEKVEAR